MGECCRSQGQAEIGCSPVTTCGCPQSDRRRRPVLQTQQLIYQDAVDERLLDDTDPARTSCYLDQLRGGGADEQQYGQVGAVIEKLLHKRWTTQTREIGFDQQTASFCIHVWPQVQKRLRVGIRADLNAVGLEQGRQALAYRMIRIHNMDHKLALFQKPLPNLSEPVCRVSPQLGALLYWQYRVNICGCHDVGKWFSIRLLRRVQPRS